MQPFIRKTMGGFLRFAIGIIIIAYIFSKIDFTELFQIAKLVMAAKSTVLVAIVLCFVSLLSGAIRWNIILETKGIKSSFSRIFCMFFIGHFFNSFLFGSAGGDIVRAYYLAKSTHHKKAEAVATVLIDRLFGFMALCTIGVIMIVVARDFFFSRHDLSLAASTMLVMFFGILLLCYLVFKPQVLTLPLFKKVEKLFPRLTLIVKKMVVIMHLYRRRWLALFLITVLSFAGHLLLIYYSWLVGSAMGINLPFLTYLAVIPTVLTISALPITPGGLGVREGLAVIFLNALGCTTEQAVLLSLFLYFLTLLWSLFGGLIFVFYGSSFTQK
jgi:uncharacterized protein (TIRG00374 family)